MKFILRTVIPKGFVTQITSDWTKDNGLNAPWFSNGALVNIEPFGQMARVFDVEDQTDCQDAMAALVTHNTNPNYPQLEVALHEPVSGEDQIVSMLL